MCVCVCVCCFCLCGSVKHFADVVANICKTAFPTQSLSKNGCNVRLTFDMTFDSTAVIVMRVTLFTCAAPAAPHKHHWSGKFKGEPSWQTLTAPCNKRSCRMWGNLGKEMTQVTYIRETIAAGETILDQLISKRVSTWWNGKQLTYWSKKKKPLEMLFWNFVLQVSQHWPLTFVLAEEYHWPPPPPPPPHPSPAPPHLTCVAGLVEIVVTYTYTVTLIRSLSLSLFLCLSL